MTRRAHVFGLSARTPVGLSAKSAAAAVRAGVSGVTSHPTFLDANGDALPAALDRLLAPSALGVGRLGVLAAHALRDVLATIPLPLLDTQYVRISLSMPELRPGFGSSEKLALIEDVVRRVPINRPSILKASPHSGHAGGLCALHDAAGDIQRGSDEIWVVGGVESYFDVLTMNWLHASRQLHSHRSRSGFIPGEAAAFVALASDEVLRRFGLSSFATIRGGSAEIERNSIKSDSVNDGRALADVVHGAAASLRLPDEAPDTVYCDINGERFRSEEWGMALLKKGSIQRRAGYVAPADCWGDVGAASGPLFCALAAQSWERCYAAGPRALLWAGSESGLRAATVLEASPYSSRRTS